ncbi:MAG: Asp23/Gls24 family envelope stress response protein [Lachnospiraceae bacterium]|nr:Asp23/Gls24 family envelope stress response protein [Lachnospiraceae bacterium]MBQ2557407.1 Asp23/Gls24 family envelope stress response protein [Lachnospiraceae bacterium]
MSSKDTREPVYEAEIEIDGTEGQAVVSDDVIATVVGLAAAEVEGVAHLSGNLTKDVIGRNGIKNNSKGVKISLIDGRVATELSICVQYGYSVPRVAKNVQEKVRSAIESMLGFASDRVTLHVVGVDLDRK